MEHSGDRWLTTRQASAYLGYSMGYLRELAGRDAVPHERTSGGQLRFKQSRLDEWIDGRKIQSGNHPDGETE